MYKIKGRRSSFGETYEKRMLLYFVAVNHLTSVLLKLVFCQMRPESSGRKDYGMPSSHGMFSGFLSVYVAIKLKGDLKRKGMILAFCSLICFSRWALGQHDLLQLIVGIGCGALMGNICPEADHLMQTIEMVVISNLDRIRKLRK
jgi:membrane-associated phospholipid phosphatase